MRNAVGCILLLSLCWSLLQCRPIYQPAVAPRLPNPSWAIESLEDWCRLQLLRRRWGHVVRSYWLVGKAGTPWVLWRRSACCKLLGLRWGIRCTRWWWRTADHVAEEIIQVPSRRLRHVSWWSKRGCYALGRSGCSTKGIRLLYPTSGRCSGV